MEQEAERNSQEDSSSDCGHHHDHHHSHDHGHTDRPNGAAYVFGAVQDPSDLSTIPEAFYSDPVFKNRPFMRDADEMKYIRCVVASFFNYRVVSAHNRMMPSGILPSLRETSSG